LLDATAAELIEGGYDRMSTNKIARRAKVSIGSLYQYFPNKEALVVALKMRLAEEEREQVREALAKNEGADLETLSRAILQSLIGIYTSKPELYKVFATQVPPIAGLEPNWEADQLIGRILLRYMQDHPDVAKVDDPEMAVFFVVQAVDAILNRALMQRPQYMKSDTFVGELVRLIIGFLSGHPRPSPAQ
jgi:AcrR family transcriptional regulator